MRFEVPQFIEIEDKIFGPFTWKQFIYLVGGAGSLFILYTFLPFIFVIIFGTPIAALAVALAFYRYNERPFVNTLESFVGYLMHSKLYLWRKESKKIVKKEGAATQSYVPPSSSSLASMARKLEINALQNKR
ncbi:PrgI family protein [Patescibacteria group bacterium]|jgi:hypothetical protein|nr:PrgI family protein [Patescibacteria group bacterium]